MATTCVKLFLCIALFTTLRVCSCDIIDSDVVPFAEKATDHGIASEKTDSSELEYIDEKDQYLSSSKRFKRSPNRWDETRNDGDERWERAAISRQSSAGNQLHKPRSRSRGECC